MFGSQYVWDGILLWIITTPNNYTRGPSQIASSCNYDKMLILSWQCVLVTNISRIVSGARRFECWGCSRDRENGARAVGVAPRGVQSLRAECNFFSKSGAATQKRRRIDDKFLVRRKLPRTKLHCKMILTIGLCAAVGGVQEWALSMCRGRSRTSRNEKIVEFPFGFVLACGLNRRRQSVNV